MTALSTGHSRGIRCGGGGGCKWITHSSRKQLEARERAAAPTTPCGLNTKSKRLSRSAVRRQSGFRRQIFLTEVPCKARRRSWPSQLESSSAVSLLFSLPPLFSLSLSLSLWRLLYVDEWIKNRACMCWLYLLLLVLKVAASENIPAPVCEPRRGKSLLG
jgi:hypothetical protein